MAASQSSRGTPVRRRPLNEHAACQVAIDDDAVCGGVVVGDQREIPHTATVSAQRRRTTTSHRIERRLAAGNGFASRCTRGAGMGVLRGHRRTWIFLAGVFVLVLAMQVVPYGRDHANPPVVREPAWDSADTRELARRACFDCHSNETEWPLYARLAPASWLVQYDVDEGRRKLNFSEWHRPQDEADEAAEVVREGEMPLRIYRVMHAHARLSAAERDRLAQGLARSVGNRPHGDR
jgi:mono/diheme cytochrome c family protein